MIQLERVMAIAGNTLREAIRNRVLYGLLFFAIMLIGAGIVIGGLSYSDNERIFQTIGLSAIRIFSTATAIFLGVGLIYKEIERRTIYTIVSKPISRGTFLVGKYLGLVAAVWIQLFLMGVVFATASLLWGAPFGWTYAIELGLLMAELALVVAVATLFSSFSTPMLASLFSTGVIVAGHLTQDLRAIGAQSRSENVRMFTEVLYKVMPDLTSFNLTLPVVHGFEIEAAQVWVPMFYGCAYSLLLLLLAVVIFERRDFN